MKKRITSQNVELLTHVLTILATHGWDKTDSASFGYPALEWIAERFKIPLEKANVNLSLLQEEWDDIVDYARRGTLISVQDDYKSVWWKLYNAPSAPRWFNILSVSELIFCIPVSNGYVERCFSQLKLIKTDRRNCLSENTLDNLLRIQLDGPDLVDWDPKCAIELWGKDKVRRIRFESQESTSTDTEQQDQVQIVSKTVIFHLKIGKHG